MNKILLGMALTIAMAVGVWLGLVLKHDHTLTTASATYLFSETEVLDKDGKPLSRADLLDALLREAVKKAQ